MKMTMNFSDFIDQWPESRKDQFSYEGKKALFDYLEELEQSTGEEVEFDPIALCCEYTEYENLAELQKDYQDIESLEELQDRTQFIPIYNNNGTESERFIIQQY